MKSCFRAKTICKVLCNSAGLCVGRSSIHYTSILFPLRHPSFWFSPNWKKNNQTKKANKQTNKQTNKKYQIYTAKGSQASLIKTDHFYEASALSVCAKVSYHIFNLNTFVIFRRISKYWLLTRLPVISNPCMNSCF